MNYADTKAKFLRRLNRRDCTDALADDFLQDAITRIQRVLRVPALEKSVVVTLTADTYYTSGRLPIPSDYLKLRQITINNQPPIDKQDLGSVLRLVGHGSGMVSCFARQGGAWVFGPVPDTTYTDPTGVVQTSVVRIDYYAEFPTEATPTADTILTDIASDLLVYGALSYACDHFTDKRGPAFEGRFTQALSDLQAQGDDDELSGGAAVTPAFCFPED